MDTSPYAIIFLDIDGTLIQPDQTPNSQDLPRIISQLSQKNIVCGLNSNRAIEDLAPIYTMFNLSGPLVSENGVYYKNSLTDTPHYLIENPIKLQPILDEAIKLFIDHKNLKTTYKVTDTTKEIINESYKNLRSAIYLNKFRLHTGSIHTYEHGKRSPKLSKELAAFIKDYTSRLNLNLNVIVPKTFGNIIITPQNAHKGIALKKFRHIYASTLFYMIGDDTPDLDTLAYVEDFFAVSNALSAVKKQSSYSSNEPYTLGVIDILQRQFLV